MPATEPRALIQFEVDGEQREVVDDGAPLSEVLRDRLGITSVKDGCSPQGQCGCCTVLVDGEPRVSCVTPTRRVAGRSITTLDGLDAEVRDRWGEVFCAAGASQCGFCTPGIVVRLEALRRRGTLGDPVAVDRGLAAHLCRCTGWNTITEAAAEVASAAAGTGVDLDVARDLDAASRRASIEGRAHQVVSPQVALGHGGFGDDSAPADALVAVPDGDGGWAVAETMSEARALAGKVQGRRTTVAERWPIDVRAGDWALTLQTTWVEPAYLETDAVWCTPGGEPSSSLANGGAFGGKVDSTLGAVARRLADEHGRAVRLRWSREDVVRSGPKRPPMALAVDGDGRGVVHVARTDGVVDRITSVAPGFDVIEVDVAGPPTSVELRGTGWVEAAVISAVLAARRDGAGGGAPVSITSPEGATATVSVGDDGRLSVVVRCGDPLDEVVLRSYCVGAAHMALGWVTSEALSVDEDGVIGDLTIRSFGIVRPAAMPEVDVTIEPDDGEPVNGSDAVFAAVAAAVWMAQGCPPRWPTGLPWPIPVGGSVGP